MEEAVEGREGMRTKENMVLEMVNSMQTYKGTLAGKYKALVLTNKKSMLNCLEMLYALFEQHAQLMI